MTFSQQNCADAKIQIAGRMCFLIMWYIGETVCVLKLTSNYLFVLLSSFTCYFDSLQWNILLTVWCYLLPLVSAEQNQQNGNRLESTGDLIF